MADENLTLKESIAQAMETLSGEVVDENIEEKAVEKPVEKAKTEKIENKTEEKTEEVEITETPEQLQQALNLYRTLTDPKASRDFVAQLAKDVGLEIKDTRITPEVATKTIVDKLKESLGEENEDLALRLAPVLEDLLKDAVKPTENLKLDQQIKEAQNEVNTVFEKLSKELPDFDKLASEMDTIMKEMAPAKGVQMEKYLRQIYKLAGGTVSSSTSSEKVIKQDTKVNKLKEIEKISKNAKETKQNVSSDVEEDRTTKALERPTAKQAVMMAVRELQGKN